MLTLLKNLRCFAPQSIGEKDLVLAADKIYKITSPGQITDTSLFQSVISCRGLYAFPGFIDQHVHMAGAGGEQGFSSRTKELEAPELFNAGITTAVGLLGADGTTRGMENLYAKAKALEAEGLTTYIYSGSYGLPPVTLTGSLLRDMVLIDKVLGAGEIAVSDHRSSDPDVRDLIQLASGAHLGGLIAGKTGIVHLHIGDGKSGLQLLTEALCQSDLPMEMFIPTHTNRNPVLFRQAVIYCKSGGRIDLTAGEAAGMSVPEAVRQLTQEHIDLSKVTISSDAGGSIPSGGAASPSALYADFVEILKKSVLPPDQAVCLLTENAAKALNLYPCKGAIREGSDADLLITDKAYSLKMLFCMGKLMIHHT
jgi:beta-aspartyl-dipeptidase (metallo-type)